MPLLSYISTSRCLIFISLSCSFVAYIAILDINVNLNVQLFLVVDEIHFSLQFNSIGMVKRFWIVGLWYEFLSWVPYVIDIWSRCIKMVPSKFDVFMYLFWFVLVFYAFFFTYHFISAKYPNFNKWSCQMAQRQRWDSPAAGFDMFLDIL